MQTLDRISASVHRPKGKYADKEQLFAELQTRIVPAAKCIAPDGPCITPEKTSVTKRPSLFAAHRRAAIAAGFLLVLGLGIAGIWQYNAGIWQSEEASTETSSPTIRPEALVFENAPLSEIIAELSSRYSVSIRLSSPALADYRITATFAPEESLEEVLDALSAVTPFTYHQEGTDYVISQ